MLNSAYFFTSENAITISEHNNVAPIYNDNHIKNIIA